MGSKFIPECVFHAVFLRLQTLYAFLSEMRPFAKGRIFILLILFQYTPAGKPPSIAVHRKAQFFTGALRAAEKSSKRDTCKGAKTLHKAKNCRYFQQISGFCLLS